jgi:hypothetical protein
LFAEALKTGARTTARCGSCCWRSHERAVAYYTAVLKHFRERSPADAPVANADRRQVAASPLAALVILSGARRDYW